MKKALFTVVLLIVLSLALTAAAEGDVMLLEDKCETAADNVTVLSPSVDGTNYYHTDNGANIGYLPYENSGDFVYELDVRFNVEGGGFSFMKNGKWNSCIRIKDGYLSLQTGSNSFHKLTAIDLTKWYHFTFLGRTNKEVNPITYGHIILEEYNDKGERVNRQVFENVNLRNNAATHFINLLAGCDADNLRAYSPEPTSLSLTSDSESVVSGGSVQFTPAAYYNDLPMHGINSSAVEYAVYDSENLYPLEDENIAIDNAGLLTTDPLTPSQRINVRVTSRVSGKSVSLPLDIMTGDVFTVLSVGFSSDNTKITQLCVNKNFSAYKDDVTFVFTFTDAEGRLNYVDYKSLYGSTLTEGENRVNVNIPIADGNINIFVITGFSNIDKEQAVKVSADSLLPFDATVTVLTLKDGADVEKLKKEDIIGFDVTDIANVNIPKEGTTYIFGTVKKIDTLVEVQK